MELTMGKGSKRRPTDSKKFDDNWDRIFKRKKDDRSGRKQS